MEKLIFAVATRARASDFYETTATGRSLKTYNFPFLEVHLFPENNTGLPKLYNSVIRRAVAQSAIIVFAHDDLHILDFYWVERLREGLKQFQIVGLAGNKRRLPRQPAWAFIDEHFTWDDRENLSGIVGHGSGFPPRKLSIFGAPNQQVKLLDGLLLATHTQTLAESGLMFDERYDFHFYDMDFCRAAELKNVTCGTCALSLIHESAGNFRSEAWRTAYAAYLEKWGD